RFSRDWSSDVCSSDLIFIFPHNSMPSISLYRIFLIFLQLGCISFGGPAAHLVFFHRKFVMQLQWLNDTQYSQLVALAQLLPGPRSEERRVGKEGRARD